MKLRFTLFFACRKYIRILKYVELTVIFNAHSKEVLSWITFMYTLNITLPTNALIVCHLF